jgi:hypothetical protein
LLVGVRQKGRQPIGELRIFSALLGDPLAARLA